MLSAALRSPAGSVCPQPGPVDSKSLSNDGKVLAEYIWLGGSGADLRSRTVVLDAAPASVEALPVAEIDGSSCGAAMEEHCEVYLKPRKIFPDPMRGGQHILVLCDTFVPPLFDVAEVMATGSAAYEMQPHPSNTRAACEQVMAQAAGEAPMFSVQQEYCCQLDPLGGLPPNFGSVTGAPMGAVFGGAFVSAFGGRSAAGKGQGFGAPGSFGSPGFGDASLNNGLVGSFGCGSRGVTSGTAPPPTARAVAEAHMQACLGAGLKYTSMQQLEEGAWAYKIGPCGGIDLGDELWASRHLLARACERAGCTVAFKRHLGDEQLPGSLALEFSTAALRDAKQGMAALQQLMLRLQVRHDQDMGVYASITRAQQHDSRGHNRHSSGRWHSAHQHHHHHSSPHSSSSPFSVGVGSKRAAIMIPSTTLLNKCGSLVDHRPPSSCDPYTATMLLLSSALGIPLPPGCPSLNPHPSSSLTTFSCGACSARSASCISGDSASLGNSEDVLISELERRDGRSYGRTTRGLSFVDGGSGYCGDEGSMGETSSDGESPLRDAPLAAAAANDDMAY